MAVGVMAPRIGAGSPALAANGDLVLASTSDTGVKGNTHQLHWY